MGTLSFFFSEVDLNKLLEEIRENMKERIKEKNLKFFVEGIGKLPKIFTDGERVKQVLINLIDNAIKYTPKGEIRVKAVKRNGFIRFEVKDTGIGIPKTFHEKIFTPFFQIDSPLTRKAKGSGLGLSICKIIVEKLGGKIWFKSEEGKGTTFYFTLPLKRM
ncbi:MAG TPA: HAMP domain-containing histidine kinase [Candidatus Aenigmarchaeota archaeon]|nr:HAMP domain-containing histidine kinase [Candidatus Aenigmarchaeota archaeon]